MGPYVTYLLVKAAQAGFKLSLRYKADAKFFWNMYGK